MCSDRGGTARVAISPVWAGARIDCPQGPGGGTVYAADLKSAARKGMWVRVPPRASRADRVESPADGQRGRQRAGGGDVQRRAAGRAPAEGPRREQAVHAERRAPVLDLRRLSRGGDRDRRRAPRVDGRVRRRGLGEGDARARRVRAHGGPGRDERDERDGLGAGQPLADARARRPRAGGALGDGVAAGDRPRAVRASAQRAGQDRGKHRGDPRPGRRGVRRRARAARRSGVRRLPDGLRVHGGARPDGCAGRGRRGGRPRAARGRARGERVDRGGRAAPARRPSAR